jgi:parallel beta-helix repeat protein
MAVGAAILCSGCATGITSTPEWVGTGDATFPGKVVSDAGGQVEYWAQYGPTTAYGSQTAHQTVTVAKNALVTVHVTIPGLQRATTYHYRLCAQDSQQKGGPGCGADKQVTTQTYGCGETVTTSFQLTGNLDCPQQAGFVVGANGIDVNLAGHTMNGEIAVGAGGPDGIDNTGGYDDVTIRNGTITGFGTAIHAGDVSRNHILNIKASAAGNAVSLDASIDSEIRRSDLFGRSIGILASGQGTIVADTSASASFGGGIDVAGANARIVRNRAVRNGASAQVASGILYGGSGGRVANNFVSGAWSGGALNVGGQDIVVEGNQVFDATDPGFPTPTPEIGDGIFVRDGATGILLRGNVANGNADDGIDVRARGASLEDNSASGNGGWGILAVPGVTDLGGNTASGNGAGQCQNVFCP